MSEKVDNNDNELFRVIDSDDPLFCSKMSPMTSEELKILGEMRELKNRARAIKEQLAHILPDWKRCIRSPQSSLIPDEAKSHLQQLDELRIKWKERESAYRGARHKRMVALGHENP